MRLEKTTLYDYLFNTKAIKAFSEKSVTFFCSKHSTNLFRCILKNNKLGIKHKLFGITDNTKKRIANVPTNELTGAKLIGLKDKAGETGYVFFDDIYFIYSISLSGICIMTSSQKKIASQSHNLSDFQIKTSENNTLFSMANTISGFIYIDFFSDTLDWWVNNVIDLLNNKNSGLSYDEAIKPILKTMIKEMEEKDMSKWETYNNQKADFDKKFNDTKLCLQAFMFIHFAKIINTTRISVENENLTFSQRLRKSKGSSLDIIKVDTFYDETMKVINPFGVCGHWRNQPIGQGRNETKLIYIDSFMKDGYTRVATKLKENI